VGFAGRVALLDAGRVFFDANGNPTFSGHFGFSSGDVGAFCAALA
jgi:hypothetical protein